MEGGVEERTKFFLQSRESCHSIFFNLPGKLYDSGLGVIMLN